MSGHILASHSSSSLATTITTVSSPTPSTPFTRRPLHPLPQIFQNERNMSKPHILSRQHSLTAGSIPGTPSSRKQGVDNQTGSGRSSLAGGHVRPNQLNQQQYSKKRDHGPGLVFTRRILRKSAGTRRGEGGNVKKGMDRSSLKRGPAGQVHKTVSGTDTPIGRNSTLSQSHRLHASTHPTEGTHPPAESTDQPSDDDSEIERPLPAELWKRATERVRGSVRALQAFRRPGKTGADGRGEDERRVEPFDQVTMLASKINFKMSTYRRQPPNPNLQLGPSLLSALHHAAQEPPTPLSENEIDLIFRLTSRVPAFAKYEEGVRRALASVVRYEVFGAGRVVVRQGHQAQNFYHILAGQVEVTKQVEDRVVVLSTLRGGDSFGETSLLHNHRRSATVTTLSTPTAFLRVSKADFLSILQAETERDIDAKAELIGSIPMFACLGAASVRHLATVSRTRSLGVGDVVVAEGSVPAFVFIVRDGACNVIKAAPFIRHPAKNGRTRLQPYIPPAPSTSPRRRRATDISRANLKTRERKMSIMLGLGGGGGNASLWFATPTVISGVAGAGGGTASSGKQASRASLLSGGGNNTGRLLTTGSRGNISFLPSLPTSTNLTAAQRPSRTPAIYKSPPSASPPPSTQLTTLLLRVVSLLPGDHIGTTSAILSHSPTHLIRPLPANSTPFSPFSLIAARPTRVLLISSPDFARLCNQEMAEMIGKEERSWQEVLGWEALAAGWRRGCEWRKFRKSVVEEVRKRAEQERERMFWDLKS